MSRKIIPLPSFTQVSAGADTSLTLPVGGNTYERILVEYSGATLAQLENIEVRLNGDPIQHFKTGQQLEYINDYYGRPKTSGIFSLWAIRPEMTNIQQRRMTAWGTLNVDHLSIHLDVDGAATSPTLKAHAIISAPRPMIFVNKVKQFPHNSAVSGQVDIDNIPRGPRIVAAHLFKSDISDVEIEMDNVKFYDASKSLAEAIQQENGRVPQTAQATHIDFLGDNDIGNALITANARDFRIKPTLDTSGATDICVEYLDRVA
ncbi:hypothetical protein HBA55_34515 [Pseudomaricurvus alkylphenolicus]|uniref:major capsid protein P2 n=1 Tax=Pseudomaricurvus alkylphenolicus TaxID=1306991 RepID=UPI001420012D|nr:major capsid protein P2 [Pseudomaricurvus alkylphenolicus]NIB44745.1 hypothetical protein [Pseudomaricurvus alkylphenolicus]